MSSIGIIGCGHVAAHHHLPALVCIPNATVAAITDLNLDSAQALAAQFGVKQVGRQLKDVLPYADVISVLTPAIAHLEQAKRVLEAGKHLFVEKPLALNRADAFAMVE